MDGDCELGEKCDANSSDERRCYIASCIEPAAVKQRRDRRVCLDVTDCREHETCSCKFWPECRCEDSKAAAVQKEAPKEVEVRENVIYDDDFFA